MSFETKVPIKNRAGSREGHNARPANVPACVKLGSLDARHFGPDPTCEQKHTQSAGVRGTLGQSHRPGSMCVSWQGCHTKCRRQRLAQQKRLLTAPEARSPRSACQQCCFLLRPLLLALRWTSSPVSSRGLPSPKECPNVLHLHGHQARWLRTRPGDLVLT